MCRSAFFIFLAFSCAFLSCSNPKTPVSEDQNHEDQVDLKSKWGADEYGMKSYVMAFLLAGPNRNQSDSLAAEIQKAHMANIERMANEGTLVLAGPFLDEQDIKGIYLFNVTSVEEAQALTNTDPAVQAGRLIMELHPWYGSAALMEVNSLHSELQSKSISEQ